MFAQIVSWDGYSRDPMFSSQPFYSEEVHEELEFTDAAADEVKCEDDLTRAKNFV